MARFTLTIDCDNAAFADDPASEIARILKVAAATVEYHGGVTGGDAFHLLDMNGNKVGQAEYESEA